MNNALVNSNKLKTRHTSQSKIRKGKISIQNYMHNASPCAYLAGNTNDFDLLEHAVLTWSMTY